MSSKLAFHWRRRAAICLRSVWELRKGLVARGAGSEALLELPLAAHVSLGAAVQPRDTQSSHAEAQELEVGAVSVAKGNAVWEAIAAIFLVSHTENNPNVYQS